MVKQENGKREVPAELKPEVAGKSAAASASVHAVAKISSRAAARLRAGHVWVYQSDVVQMIPAMGAAAVEPGSLVAIEDGRGQTYGTALFSSASQITLRLVSQEDVTGRPAFLGLLRERLVRAIGLRKDLLAGTAGTNASRLVFSEADGLPGIVIDRYGELAILQLVTQGTNAEDVRAVIVETLRTELGDEIQTIIERPDPRMRELEQLPPAAVAPLYARDVENPVLNTVFELNGLRFHYEAGAGQKTGAFLDQRENYAVAARYARGEGLDICTYQGGFALHMARVCERVTGVDSSRAALEVAERNLQLNSGSISAEVDWIEASAFDLLRDWSDAGRTFDTIVLDPPAFAKSKRAAEGALRGYKELNLRALKMLRPGGVLVTCSCSHHIPLAEFTAVVAAAASDAGRRVRLVETRGASLDHPAILTLPETSYLKCLVCVAE